MANPGSLDKYAYVEGDPVNFADPSQVPAGFVGPNACQRLGGGIAAALVKMGGDPTNLKYPMGQAGSPIMPTTSFLSGFLILGVVCAGGQGRDGADTKTERIVSKKYKFSVVRPDKWYVFLGADTPSFYNYGAEKAPADGSVPPGGANIWMHASASQPPEQGELSRWAGKIVAADHGSNAREQSIQGPGSTGLEVTFEQLPLGTPGDTLGTVVLAWRPRNSICGAELTYHKGDPHAAEYERVLFEVMRSFRPL